MKPSAASALCALLACTLLQACSQWRYDLGPPLPAVELPPEDTSLRDVLALLGPPLRMTATDSGFVLAWEHWHIRENELGIRLGALGADFLSADWGDVRVEGEFLLLTFNREYRLTAATRSHWNNDGGGGQAIQPLFGFVSVVDTDDLLEPLPQHHWGGAHLQYLPGTLNRDSSLDTGQSGLQQRGTPTAIGQQSLQME